MNAIYNLHKYNTKNKFGSHNIFSYEKKIKIKIKIPQTTTNLIIYKNKKIKIQQNIIHLKINCYYQYKIILSSNVKYLYVQLNLENKIMLPYSLTHLSIFYNILHKLKLHKNITHLILGDGVTYDVNLIPYHITHLKFEICYLHRITIPRNIINLTIGKKIYGKIIYFLLQSNVKYLTLKYINTYTNILIPTSVIQITLPAMYSYDDYIKKNFKISHRTKICYEDEDEDE